MNARGTQFGQAVHVLGEQPLACCPTGEWIFPSVVSTDRLQGTPLGRWYLYYSPHDAPGGICLAHADRIAGPWTEYPHNPLIARDWPPHYRVSHVASPHTLWIDDLGRLALWFHGENDTTRLATSSDGLRFDYQGVAISSHDMPQLREMSYARVFPLPAGHGQRYVMLYMGRADRRRCIYVARSSDAMNWSPDPDPLIVPPPELGDNTSAAWLARRNGRLAAIHHIGRFVGDPSRFDLSGSFYVTELSDDLTQAGQTTLFYQSAQGWPDNRRVADVQLVEEDGRLWMLYVGGRRLKGRIYARPVDAEGSIELLKPSAGRCP